MLNNSTNHKTFHDAKLHSATAKFDRQIGLQPVTTPVRSPQSNGMAESFVKTMKRDYVAHMPKPDRETALRNLTTRLKAARLHHNVCLEDIEYTARLAPEQSADPATGQWLRDGLNLIIGGPTGVGKTWLACALARKACRDGYSVRYLRLPRLMKELGLAHDDSRFAKLMAKETSD